MLGPAESLIEHSSPPALIGVLADTHIYAEGRRILPRPVLDLFQRLQVGLILHCGDINDRTVLDELGEIASVVAVRGNTDDLDLQEILPLKTRIRLGVHEIGLVHGHEGGRTAREAAYAAFPESTQLVVYGHSHLPMIETRGRTVYFNPGSPTDRRQGPHFGMGFLRCDDTGVEPHLVLFARPSDLEHVTLPGPRHL